MRYAFFYGLDGAGVETTLEEYQNADVGWEVHTLMQDPETRDKYSLLLCRSAGQ